MPRPRAANPRNAVANVRLTEDERADMEAAAEAAGHRSLSDYVRSLHADRMAQQPEHAERDYASELIFKDLFLQHQTNLGSIYWGDSRAYLFDERREKSVDLIMTSPPFGLVRKKDYGNEDANLYCEWFRPFAAGFDRVLKDTGSLVIDIGGAWQPGRPTRSLYHFKLLVMLVEEFGFHLCQEHYWWNPSKLPTPAEWVNIRRVRVKDAVNCVWWLSKTPYPKASNKRVLQPYSDSMRSLLQTGYVAKKRPSGHQISAHFMKDNGGSVPPNLLAIANTESTGAYQEYCRAHNLPIHPARFPPQLPEYFIRMLTDEGDTVLDPFAGSCVTGAVAEALDRRWACCELSEEYIEGALARFAPGVHALPKERDVTYTIPQPCTVPNDDVPLVADGGRTRPKKDAPVPSERPRLQPQGINGGAPVLPLAAQGRSSD